MTVRALVVGQFAHPRGGWGRLAGWVMARRESNRRRNRWTIERLDLRAGERVLEVGFGPGLALEHAVAAVGRTGRVWGIDRSDVMLAQATARNTSAVAAGVLDLRVASVESLPDFGVAFDAIYAVNSVGFWPDPVERLRALRALLVPAGRLALTVQPRSKGATAETSTRTAVQLEGWLRDAGFTQVTTHALPLSPPAVCVIGRPTDELLSDPLAHHRTGRCT